MFEFINNAIREVQNGSGVDRSIIPESMRGEVANTLWHNPIFGYGAEYGYIAAMLEVKQKLQDYWNINISTNPG
jgi:hypothetical protein